MQKGDPTIERGKSPNIQPRHSVIADNFKQSPRVNRAKNVSPPSREKGSVMNVQQPDDKIAHNPNKVPNQSSNGLNGVTGSQQSAANQSFNGQHRKTNSSKLPQINSKTVETSSLSNTYYSKE